MYSYGCCLVDKYHVCLTLPEGGYQKLMGSFSALKPGTSVCLWTCGVWRSHTKDILALFFHCLPHILTCKPAVAFWELVNLMRPKSNETVMQVYRPGLCVQSKEPQWYRSMGPGQSRTQKVSMVCNTEKIISADSSLEVSCKCLGKIS